MPKFTFVIYGPFSEKEGTTFLPMKIKKTIEWPVVPSKGDCVFVIEEPGSEMKVEEVNHHLSRGQVEVVLEEQEQEIVDRLLKAGWERVRI